MFIDLERNEDAWDVILQMGHDINEWNDPINVRLLQSSDFYAAQLRAIPERWDDGMQDVISHAVLIFNQCREHLTITPRIIIMFTVSAICRISYRLLSLTEWTI